MLTNSFIEKQLNNLKQQYKNILNIKLNNDNLNDYIQLIKNIHEDFIKFDFKYHFLIKQKLINNIPFIEYDIENICSILKEFISIINKQYNNLVYNNFENYKNKIIIDLINSVWGKEYLKNNFIIKNIEDGYDAGWLSPAGEYIAANGSISSMIHYLLAETIWKGHSIYAIQMNKDNVYLYHTLNPEYWLEKEGWLKIHHDEIYGYFKLDKNIKIKNKEDRVLYCPTKKQIEMICKYVNKFYNGKFYMTPSFLRNNENLLLYTRDIKQMDEIALHNAFIYKH